MEYYDDEAIDELIKNLNRIPRDITSKISIKELSERLARELGKKVSL